MPDLISLTSTAVIVGQNNSSSGGSILQLLFLGLIPLAMYFLLVRPQRRRQNEMKALQASIGVGDEVITTSGIYGFITGAEDDLFWLEIDDDVQIRIARAAIQGRAPVKSDDDPDETTSAIATTSKSASKSKAVSKSTSKSTGKQNKKPSAANKQGAIVSGDTDDDSDDEDEDGDES